MSWTPWGRPDRELLRGLGSRVFEDPRATLVAALQNGVFR